MVKIHIGRVLLLSGPTTFRRLVRTIRILKTSGANRRFCGISHRLDISIMRCDLFVFYFLLRQNLYTSRHQLVHIIINYIIEHWEKDTFDSQPLQFINFVLSLYFLSFISSAFGIVVTLIQPLFFIQKAVSF